MSTRKSDTPRRTVIKAGVASVILVALASFISAGLTDLGCIGEGTARHCVETEGGRVPPIEVLLVGGPSALVVLATFVSLRTRRLWPVLCVAALSFPAALLLPPVAWQ